MHKRFLRWTLLAAGLVLLGGCASKTKMVWNQCVAPEAALRKIWASWQKIASAEEGCHSDPERGGRCAQLEREIQHIADLCPHYPPALTGAAAVAYSQKRYPEAQRYLDRTLALQPIYPGAAAMRARIAMEEGNFPFALRFLSERIQLSPDDSQLREVYAAALYFSGKTEEAKAQLRSAALLGAPGWRIAYHRGLMEEAGGEFLEAENSYEEALRQRVGWRPPQSRLQALKALRPEPVLK